jgi:uncharacterized membrane protein YbhN (UPF0104 family)
VQVAAQELTTPPGPSRRSRLVRRAVLAGLGLGVVGVTFAYLLPTIANYAEVWEVVRQLSGAELAALLGATALNLATFPPPWQVALPGLGYLRALELTQASSALAIVFPGGPAAGAAGAFGMTRRWGFGGSDVARAITLTSLWNQFFNLSFPIVGVFLLTIAGEQTAALATAAFVGVAVLGVVVAGFVLILVDEGLARDIGDVAARLASWARARFRRGPVGWTGRSFERFRADVGGFVERRWPALTATSLVSCLTVFLVLVVSLRVLDVPASQVSLAEAFAAWALIRIVASIPLTPGGIGVSELGLTGTLVGLGGGRAHVVAAVLVYRFLTVVPTLVLGLVAAFTSRREITLSGGHGTPSAS